MKKSEVLCKKCKKIFSVSHGIDVKGHKCSVCKSDFVARTNESDDEIVGFTAGILVSSFGNFGNDGESFSSGDGGSFDGGGASGDFGGGSDE